MSKSISPLHRNKNYVLDPCSPITAIVEGGGFAVDVGDLSRFIVAVVNNGVVGELVGRMRNAV